MARRRRVVLVGSKGEPSSSPRLGMNWLSAVRFVVFVRYLHAAADETVSVIESVLAGALSRPLGSRCGLWTLGWRWSAERTRGTKTREPDECDPLTFYSWPLHNRSCTHVCIIFLFSK